MKIATLLVSLMIVAVECLNAQQTVTVISRCGGTETITIPTITDNDLDGMDDNLEQRLLNHFMPVIIQFSGESCPGPALNGTGDSNLVVCHIFAYPQQYTANNTLSAVQQFPTVIVPKKGLTAGLVWYNPLIMVHTAILYGKDCGLSGHPADVEGFTFSLKYIGPDTAAGWMYDTVLANWRGGVIQTISHAATLCEQKETFPYRSSINPAGKDTIFASPDKHGNYLTIGSCGSSFICNPGCGGTRSKKNVRPINIGEDGHSLLSDLGTVYAAYSGNDPWSTANFLNAQGGSAGAIRNKMIKALTTDFASGQTLLANQICPIYTNCFGIPSYSYQDFVCSKNTPYSFYGQSISGSGTYTHNLTSSYGCDSVISLSLTVVNPATYSFNHSTCSGTVYNFNGRTLTTSGTYRDTLVLANGCDSIVTLHLSFNAQVMNTISASICKGDTFNFNGQQITNAGIYIDSFLSSGGCDTIVRLNLLINQPPLISWQNLPDTVYVATDSVKLNGASPKGGSYKGNGVLDSVFLRSISGVGIHSVSYSFTDSFGCKSSVSKWFVVRTIGIEESQTARLNIYPNPIADEIIVDLSTFYGKDLSLEIVNAEGQKVFEIKQNRNFQSETHINTKDLAVGVYVLSITCEGKLYRNRVVKLVK